MTLPQIRQAVITIVKQAGEIATTYFTSQAFQQEAKSDGLDVVTQVDIEIDSFLREKLSEKFPDIHLMTEETTSGDYRYLKKKEWVFIVDALDGTINFTRRNPHFGIAVGLMQKGEMKLSVAYLPMKKEIYYADDATNGAYVNTKQICVSSINEPNQMVVACDWSNNTQAREKMLTILERVSKQTRRIKCLGSPVADLCLLAKGDIDAYIHTRLRPWDITPAYLVQKAGGKVVNFKRSDWDIFRLDIVASNQRLHKPLTKLVPFTSSEKIA